MLTITLYCIRGDTLVYENTLIPTYIYININYIIILDNLAGPIGKDREISGSNTSSTVLLSLRKSV
jgi:hypothetical protein